MRRFVRLLNSFIVGDGEHFSLTIEADDGSHTDLEIGLSDVEHILQFLIMTAAKVKPDTMEHPEYLSPMPVTGLGLSAGRSKDETLLYVRVPGTHLSFSLDKIQLALLGKGFAQTAHTLSADTLPQ